MVLTTGPSEHGHLQLSVLGDDIHDIFPPSQPALGQLGPIVLLDQKLGRTGVLVIVDDSAIDTPTEVLDEPRVEFVGDDLAASGIDKGTRRDVEGRIGQGLGVVKRDSLGCVDVAGRSSRIGVNSSHV